MTDLELTHTLMATVREQLHQPDLEYDPASALRAVPAYDSVMAIQLVLGLERTFDLMLDEDEIEMMNTLGDIFMILRSRVSVDA